MGILLPFAIGIALNPTPIIATILLLVSNLGLVKALCFLVGWLGGLMSLLITMLVIVSSREYRRAPFSAQFTDWVILAFGIVLLLMAWMLWRKRPPPDEERISLQWMRGITQANSFMALSAGLFFGLFSVRNLLLIVTAAMVIGESIMSSDGRLWTSLFFGLIASIGVAAPLVVAAMQPNRANAILTEWENWLSHHNVTINCIVHAVVAVQLLAIGLTRLT